MIAPLCPYCMASAQIVGGDFIYPYRIDLHDKKFWICVPCDAYVGTHANSKEKDTPLGTLANAELRYLRIQTHDIFDPIWREIVRAEGMSRTKARKGLYKWLALAMCIERKDCHVALFNEDQCRQAMRILGDRE